ncbi:MAG: DUF4157 domain-containing protein [Myxococcota bacterium]
MQERISRRSHEPSVQTRGGATGGADEVHAAAARGIGGGGGALPHLGAIQRAFGRHDVSDVRAHTGAGASAACDDMGAEAYATGKAVAFKGAPSLHTAAHEAAHVIQQKRGVSLKGGVGAIGDRYERHADQVADAVVQGKSAEALLDPYAAGGAGGGADVQRQASGSDRAVQRKETEVSVYWADERFKIEWKKLGNKPETIQQAMQNTRVFLGGNLPPGYMPPPWRDQAAPSSTAPAAPIGNDPNGQSVDPDAVARAQQNTANSEYGNCTSQGGDPLACDTQVTQGGGTAPDLQGGQSVDPNAAQQRGSSVSAPGGSGTRAPSGGNQAHADGESHDKLAFSKTDGPWGLKFTWDADGKLSSEVSAKEKLADSQFPLFAGCFANVDLNLKAAGSVSGKPSGEMEVKLAGGLEGSVTINGGVKDCSVYAGGAASAMLTGVTFKRSAAGAWSVEGPSVSIKVKLVTGIKVAGVKLEYTPGGDFEVLKGVFSDTWPYLVFRPGADVDRLRGDVDAALERIHDIGSALIHQNPNDAMKRMDAQSRDRQNPPGKL